MTDTIASQILQAIPMPSILVGPDQRILATNSTGRALFGDAIVDRHLATAIRHPSVLQAIEECLNDAKPRKTRYLTSRAGRDQSFDVTTTPIDLPGGRSVISCFNDMSDLEQADQMRRDFVANVSHELRTPLTALLGFIETLQGPAKNDAAAQTRFLNIMQTEATRMERLVKDLLSLSRVEAEARVRPQTTVDLTDIARSVMSSLTPMAEDNDVKFLISGIDDSVKAPGDEDQLRQVLTNLVENAIKYGGDGKTVGIHFDPTITMPGTGAPGVEISVEDQGPGIDPLHIPRLTERFYRIDSHRSREMGGTGLGLSIVKHIITRHRGRLRVESEPGQGSRFIVTLPR